MTDEPLEFIEPVELKAKMDGGAPLLVVDAQNPDEFAARHIPGARNVPVADMPEALEQIAAAQPHLTAKAADLQSQLDQRRREQQQTDDDFPF